LNLLFAIQLFITKLCRSAVRSAFAYVLKQWKDSKEDEHW